MKNKLPPTLLILTFILSACNGLIPAAPTATQTPRPSATETATVTMTPSSTPTFTPTLTPTPTWVHQGPNAIQVPILMYHHIEVSPIDSNYRISANRFEEQLKLLHDWGYTTITTTMLVNAIQQGAPLPPRPIIITFDDNNLDNYTIAFPIMQKYGFIGVEYVPFTYIGVDGYMSAEQLKEMAAAGWEIGSHSLTHINLIELPADRLRAEIVDSRRRLQDLLGVPILTFAYPFGANDSAAVDLVKFAGYIAGMGATGFTADQGSSNLFVLQRVEIKGWEDAKTFIRFLPWHGDPIFLPTDTPTPTLKPTRTPIPTYTQYPTRTP